MKNTIFIDVDTDREDKPIMFGKPPESKQPETPQEAREMIFNDIACITEALAVLIDMAHINKYGNKLELVNTAKSVLDSVIEFNHDEYMKQDNGETDSDTEKE